MKFASSQLDGDGHLDLVLQHRSYVGMRRTPAECEPPPVGTVGTAGCQSAQFDLFQLSTVNGPAPVPFDPSSTTCHHTCCDQCRPIEPVVGDYEMSNWGRTGPMAQAERGYPTCMLNGVCTNGLTWARNDGSGAFRAATAIGEGGSGLVIAQDLDGDGDIDLLAGVISPSCRRLPPSPACSRLLTTSLLLAGSVTTKHFADGVKAYYNDGSGSFTAQTPSPACSDADLLPPRDATFCTNPGSMMAPWNKPRGWGIADFDGDGDYDLLVVMEIGTTLKQTTLFRNEPMATHPCYFLPVTGSALSTLSTGATNEGFALGDVDGDGSVDVVYARAGGRNAVFINDGLGNFATADTGLLLEGITTTSAVAVADTNADGLLDFAFVNNGGRNDFIFGTRPLELVDASSIALPTGVTEMLLGVCDNCTAGTIQAEVGFSNADYDRHIDYNVVLSIGPVSTAGPYMGSYTSGTSASWYEGNVITTPVTVGDVNGDGTLDAFVGKRLFFNHGGVFTAAPTNYTSMLPTNPIVISDVDGDGT